MRAIGTVILMFIIGYVLVLLTDWYWRRKEQVLIGPRCRCGEFVFRSERRYFKVNDMLHTPRLCAPLRECIWEPQERN